VADLGGKNGSMGLLFFSMFVTIFKIGSFSVICGWRSVFLPLGGVFIWFCMLLCKSYLNQHVVAFVWP